MQKSKSTNTSRVNGHIKNEKVLDLCAAGRKNAQLLNEGAIVTALDISEKIKNLLVIFLGLI